jgi:hypothetical protein
MIHWLLFGSLWLSFLWGWSPPAPPTPNPNPETSSDRFAVPVLPSHPTQIDLGNSVYYYNCMPCHGDQLQGLTYQFRQTWVQDHQNCWARGCHGGGTYDLGFPLPKYIPGLKDLSRFDSPEALYEFLRQTHPPQRPGKLSSTDYWSVTAFLLYQSGRLAPGKEVGPVSTASAHENPAYLLPVMAAMLILAGLLVYQTYRPKPVLS